jgi:hypothetical protein
MVRVGEENGNGDPLVGEFGGEEGKLFALQAVAEAGMALRNRLEKLEVTHGDVGLIFLTDADAKLIEEALGHMPPGADADLTHVRVLMEEMRTFVAGLEHEIQMGGGDGE